MNKKGIIYGINGPVIYLKGNTGLRMSEMVHVGEEHLVGEVISLSKKATTVQVFEETTGLKPGAEVVGTGDGPGYVSSSCYPTEPAHSSKLRGSGDRACCR